MKKGLFSEAPKSAIILSFSIFAMFSARADILQRGENKEQIPKTPKERIDHWYKTYENIRKYCLQKSFAKVDCKLRKNDHQFKPYSYAYDRARVAIGQETIPALDAGVRNTASTIGLLFYPDSEVYWTDNQIVKDYERLKKALAKKAEKEKLQDCQKACLTVCASHQLINASEIQRNNHKTCHQRIVSRTGDCKSFSDIADDVNYALGVPSRVIMGTSYLRSGDELISQGGHAIIQVYVQGRYFLMEPQDRFCQFYENKFSHEVKPIEVKVMNALPFKRLNSIRKNRNLVDLDMKRVLPAAVSTIRCHQPQNSARLDFAIIERESLTEFLNNSMNCDQNGKSVNQDSRENNQKSAIDKDVLQDWSKNIKQGKSH